MQKAAPHQRIGTNRRRDPLRDVLGNAKAGRGLRLHEVLVPHQLPKRPARQHGAANDAGQATGNVVDQVNLLARQRGKGTPRQLGKQDDGHPLGSRAERCAGNQAHINGTGHHDKADEERPGHGAHSKALAKARRGLHQVAVAS